MDAHGTSSQEYDEISRRTGWHGPEILFGLMYEYIKPGQTILDIGIGTGLGSVLFHKAGLQVCGIDNSDGMLDVCRGKNFVRELMRYDLGLGAWPWGDCRFDHALSCGVFHFFQRPDLLFSETSRILRQDGTFGFTVLETPGGSGQHKDQPTGIMIYSHNPADIGDLLEKNGFSLLKKVTFHAFRDSEVRETNVFTGYVVKKQV